MGATASLAMSSPLGSEQRSKEPSGSLRSNAPSSSGLARQPHSGVVHSGSANALYDSKNLTGAREPARSQPPGRYMQAVRAGKEAKLRYPES
jgi:hypothetical protein